jgi:ribosome biogenesis protein UTP30
LLFRQPIPVNLLKKDLKSELEAAISSTYLHQNAGTCTSIKIAHTGMDPKKVIKNVETSIPAVVRKLHHVNTRRKSQVKDKKVGEIIPKAKDTKSEEELRQEAEDAWENIQSLGIKTHSSVCLPIWSCDLNDRWISAPIPSATSNQAITNGTTSVSKSRAHQEDEDTMSEGDNEELDQKLSEKMKKSSLGSPKKKSNDVLPDEGTQAKKKKRKAEIEEETGGPAKKTKLVSSSKNPRNELSNPSDSNASSGIHKRKLSSQSDATLSSQDEAAPRKRKLERAKAADFMEVQEDSTPEEIASLPSTSKKDTSRSSVSKPAASPQEKKDKEKKRKTDDGTSEPLSKGLKATNNTTPAPLSTSNTQLAASTSAPLKSALKKSNESNLTPAELSQKRAKKTTFSVVEKKKEKMSKGLLSDKGGKSKVRLVGRGPKM